jgi:hypothetical protein
MSIWVSIKDKLPDDNQEWDWVLVGCIQDNYMTAWTIARYSLSLGWEFFDEPITTSCPYAGDSLSYISIDDITHWMEIEMIKEEE